MKIHCPDCGQIIPAEQVNLESGFAKCLACNAVFDFKKRLGPRDQARATGDGPSISEPLVIPRPPRMRVEQFAGSWTVSWRWLSAQHFLMLFFCIAWDSFLIFWYKIAFSSHAPCIMVIFPVAHVAVGVGLTYSVLTGFLNRTRVKLGYGELSIRHGPLPWWGNQDIAANNIEQLYCQRSKMQKNGQFSWNLCAVLKKGEKVTLLTGFDSPDEAGYLVYELESRLHIVGRPVAGEWA